MPARHLAAVVLAAFAAGGVVPRAALVAHDHAGGGAPHVHAGGLPAAHRHDDGRWHTHGDGGAGLERARHLHVQPPFEAADRAALPAPEAGASVAAAPAAPPVPAPDRPRNPARSRGPPILSAR